MEVLWGQVRVQLVKGEDDEGENRDIDEDE